MARAEQPTATASRASRRAKVGTPGSSAQSAAGEVAEPSTGAQLVVISGLSGAGKSQAAKLFEDLGYYCVDNLPPELLDGFLALRDADQARYDRVALVLDIRAGDPAPPIKQARAALASAGSAMQVIFLDASDTALVSRFSETRHRHPLQARSGVQAGIAEERRRLAATRELADHVIDTSSLSIGQLKEHLIALLPRDGQADAVQIDIVTFGFKYGIPLEADLVFDVRFLTNPYWVPELKPLSGLQEPVREFVMKQPTAKRFLDLVAELLELTVPAYREEGRARLTVALGCTGGYHRSIALGEELATRLRKLDQGTSVAVFHRELER
jgi:RNase adapter protein RapZ